MLVVGDWGAPPDQPQFQVCISFMVLELMPFSEEAFMCLLMLQFCFLLCLLFCFPVALFEHSSHPLLLLLPWLLLPIYM